MTAPVLPAVEPDALGWLVHARCRTADPEAFFPILPNCGNAGGSDLRPAAAVAWQWCQPCPVLALCHDLAERTDAVGVWGGSLRQPVQPGSFRTVFLPLVPAAPKQGPAS